MNQIKTLGIAHLTVGLIFVLMGVWGLIPNQSLGYEPAWHAVFKIILGIIIVGVGFRFLKRA
ncbi:MAG: hypothetical protein BME94_06460 [Methanobacteriales archaeon Met13]